MKKIILVLLVCPTFCIGQIDLKIAEDYINGK